MLVRVFFNRPCVQDMLVFPSKNIRKLDQANEALMIYTVTLPKHPIQTLFKVRAR